MIVISLGKIKELKVFIPFFQLYLYIEINISLESFYRHIARAAYSAVTASQYFIARGLPVE